jgi:DNA invertase Pin-like site-specific DNA recombinase
MRLNTPKGANHPRALFDPDEVLEIRKRLGEEPGTSKAIAREKHCSTSTIYRIEHKLTYRSK